VNLTNRDIEALHKALLSAYPDLEELQMMLFFRLGLQKSDIAGNSLRTFVFNLITKAIADGLIEQLVLEAYDYNPRNILLQQFHQKHILKQVSSKDNSLESQRTYKDENVVEEYSTLAISRMFQLQSLYKSLVKRIAQENGIDDFEATSDENKLRIYTIMMGVMFNKLGSQEASEEHLEDIKVGISEAINGFFYLMDRQAANNIDTVQLIIGKLMEANANLLTAIMALQTCRMKLFEALKPVLATSNIRS
jgi:Effector-associated domain 1